MKKIIFTVSNIFEMINSKTDEKFYKLQLVKTVEKTINGSVTKARLVAYHNVQSTTLKVDDKFEFDTVNYEMVEQQFADEQGVIKTQKVIYLKAE